MHFLFGKELAPAFFKAVAISRANLSREVVWSILLQFGSWHGKVSIGSLHFDKDMSALVWYRAKSQGDARSQLTLFGRGISASAVFVNTGVDDQSRDTNSGKWSDETWSDSDQAMT